jgi:hypothetical protein
MPFLNRAQNKDDAVTPGEIAAGVAWLAFYGLLIIAGLSRGSPFLTTAIVMSGP